MRSSSPEVHDLVTRALGAYRADGVEAPANYSVQLGGHDPEHADGNFHFLYRGFNPVVRTTDPRRLFDGLVGFLEGHLPSDDELVRFDAVAFVGDDRAVIAPADLRHLLSAFERRLDRGGLRVLDRMWATIDPRDGCLVVAEPQLDVDVDARDGGLGRLPEARRREPGVPPGRYPVSGWTFGLGAEGAGPLPPAQAVVQAAKLAVNTPSVGAQGVLDAVTRALRGQPGLALWVDDPTDLATPILELAG